MTASSAGPFTATVMASVPVSAAKLAEREAEKQAEREAVIALDLERYARLALEHVWIVQTGSYDDVETVAAFVRREDAAEHAAAINAADKSAHAVELPLPLYSPGRQPAERLVFSVDKTPGVPRTTRSRPGWEYDYHQPVDFAEGPQVWNHGRCYASGTDLDAVNAAVAERLKEVPKP